MREVRKGGKLKMEGGSEGGRGTDGRKEGEGLRNGRVVGGWAGGNVLKSDIPSTPGSLCLKWGKGV